MRPVNKNTSITPKQFTIETNVTNNCCWYCQWHQLILMLSRLEVQCVKKVLRGKRKIPFVAKTVIIRVLNITMQCYKIGHIYTVLPSYAIYLLQMITFSNTAFFASYTDYETQSAFD